jgi:hypothetical protein|tara:strand:- start:189 stop:392 length:204 start_codon:yes stop_codon:yes gene_type:complete
MGKFHDDHDDNQYYSEQTAVESTQLSAQLKVEVGVSKHAARRQRKKKAQVICDADPTAETAEDGQQQ